MRRLIRQVFERREDRTRTDQSTAELRLAAARNLHSAKSLDATIEELLEHNKPRPQLRPH